jgi:hypothetical protein
LVHGVLLCSLLTTWLGKPVDVVASFRDTHGSRVFAFPMVEHRANQTSAPSEANVERNARLANCKAKFAKSKVPDLLFFHFRNL